MGLIESYNNTTGHEFVSLSNGKLVIKAQEGDSGATERVNALGKTVFEKRFSGLSGILTNVGIILKKPYGEDTDEEAITLSIEDGDTTYIIQEFINTRRGKEIVNKLLTTTDPISRPFEIKGYDFVGKEGKKITGYNYFLNGVKIGNYATKDAPNGMPLMSLIKVKGKDVWDDTEQVAFFKVKIKEWLKALFGGDSQEGEENDESKDLPF